MRPFLLELVTFTDFGPSGPRQPLHHRKEVTSWACRTSPHQQSSDLIGLILACGVLLNPGFSRKFQWSFVSLLFVSRLAVAKTLSPHIWSTTSLLIIVDWNKVPPPEKVCSTRERQEHTISTLFGGLSKNSEKQYRHQGFAKKNPDIATAVAPVFQSHPAIRLPRLDACSCLRQRPGHRFEATGAQR